MRVGFNGLFLGCDATGSGQYTRHLLQALLELEDGPEYWVFKPQEPQIAGQPDCASGAAAPIEYAATLSAGRWRNLDKLWFEQITFPRLCRRAAVDLCHVPYFAPPLCPGVPMVVTIHDLIPLLLPEYRSSLSVQLYTLLVSAAARRSDLIITDSQHSRQDIIEHLGIDPDRVRVIYLAAAPSCRAISDMAILAGVRQKYGLPESYILYLGGFDRRKNLEGLLQAYARVSAVLDAVPALVVAGRLPAADTPLFPDPRRTVSELAIERRVIFTGWVAEEDKPALYSGALFFAFLSLYEGFGLMPLEAMACGTPVLAARATSLPEIVGPGGLLVDPLGVDETAQAMAELVRNGGRRERLAAEASKQAARFDWKRTAVETLQAYRSVTGRGRVP
jgi:glycosyltransferase involved in cell wall biosynthesis